jgi:C-terminal processing protease CtpA/Prc
MTATSAPVLDAPTRALAIARLLAKLREAYVFPDVADAMAEAIGRRAAGGEYDACGAGGEFAAALTEHLQAVSRDKHLRVFFEAEPQLPEKDADDEARRERQRQQGQRQNFGFARVERLPGNVGYLDLRQFASPEYAGDLAVAAMQLLAHTDALIVDLRRNGGGSPAMVALLTSYLFGPQPVHLNSLHWREGDRLAQWWTHQYVPGKRYGGDKPVYVLTSAHTFSGAEEFAYNLQQLKRATLIGETTGGGAHPGDGHQLTPHFAAFIPGGRAINPISGTNWEGTGVSPDIAVPAAEALTVAQRLALGAIIERKPSAEDRDDRALADEAREALAGLGD